jgi:hypothetical protein
MTEAVDLQRSLANLQVAIDVLAGQSEQPLAPLHCQLLASLLQGCLEDVRKAVPIIEQAAMLR